MSNKTLARRYALALVSLGKESNCLVELSDGLAAFSEALQEANLAINERAIHIQNKLKKYKKIHEMKKSSKDL